MGAGDLLRRGRPLLARRPARCARATARLAAVLLAMGPLGCGGRDAAPGAASADGSPHPGGADSALVLELDGDALARTGAEVAPAEASQLAPELLAYGLVLDPAPASDALSNFAAARAAAEAASRELTRVEGLARDRENASAREVEAARAAAARARADLELADHQVDAVLGAARGELGDLGELGRRLSRRQAALVRLDVPGGGERPEPDRGAHLVAYPQVGEELAARFLGSAPDADPQRPGWSFLFLVDGRFAPSGPERGSPPPGSRVRARLATGGTALSGVRVPPSALLRSDGRLFVFLSQGHGRFERREVAARVLPDGSAFVTGGIEPGEPFVVTGAQQLLSAQRLAAGGGEEED